MAVVVVVVVAGLPAAGRSDRAAQVDQAACTGVAAAAGCRAAVAPMNVSDPPAGQSVPLLDAANCGPLPFAQPSTAALRSSPKKAFAFYFPPFPLSVDNKDPASDFYADGLDPRGDNGRYAAQGGYVRDRPLARPIRPAADWKQSDFEVEIRQAIAIGLDGFIWEYNDTTPDKRFQQLPAMLAAAKAVDPGFRIMLSPDFIDAAGKQVTTPETLVQAVSKVKDDPSLYRLDDGSIVLAPFFPEREPISFWTSVRDALAQRAVPTALVPIFLSSSAGMGAWNDAVHGYSTWGERWASETPSYAAQAKQAHDRGRIFMSPVAFEDVRPAINTYWEASNSSELLASFQQAIAGGADWVSLTTWNDYTESWTAPSAERGYTVSDLSAYYVSWLKTGSPPAITHDTLYYFHRSQLVNAPYDTSKQTGGPMTVPRGDPPSDRVELLAFLTGPGTLSINQGSKVETMQANGPGMVSFTVEAVAGTTPRFALERSGAVVTQVASTTPIRPQVTYQDLTYHAGSSRGC